MIEAGTFPYDKKNYKEFLKLYKYINLKIKPKPYGPVKPKIKFLMRKLNKLIVVLWPGYFREFEFISMN